MRKHAGPIVMLVAMATSSCNEPPSIAPESREETAGQALSPRLLGRIKTAETDVAQLRSFNVQVPMGTNDVIELIQGPFVITGFAGKPSYAIVNLEGTCPSLVGYAEEPFFNDNIYVYEAVGTFFVPAGAVLCAPRLANSFSYAYNVSGYVPYE